MKSPSLISESLSEFAVNTTYDSIPQEVRERAKYLMLDAIGIAFASTRYEFAQRSLDALAALGLGNSEVIGMSLRLPLRDAVMMNAILVHGLDYDDTYLPGAIHLTSSCVPCALGVGGQVKASGRDFLAAFAVGMEIAARLAVAGNGDYQQAGFHPTSVIGAFACALIAGKLWQLNATQLVMAQGIALSTAAGSMQCLQEGAETKRMQPGWAGAGGITAAALARNKFVGPSAAYEGRSGLFSNFLGANAENAKPNTVTAALGERWEFHRTSIKLFPACHHIHAFLRAAIGIVREHRVDPQHVQSIRALVARQAVPAICEPLEARHRPANSYAAQFSLPYTVASCLLRGRFGLPDLEDHALSDAETLALAKKLDYEIDPDAGFPKYRSGEIVITMNNGQELRRRENIFPEEPVTDSEIEAKFLQNAEMVMTPSRAASIRDIILRIDSAADMGVVCRALAGG